MSKKKKRSRVVSIKLEISALCIDSNYEPVTKAGFEYREKNVYPYIKSKGLVLIRCQGPLARRVYIVPEAKKQNVHYITGIGHGSPDTYTGDQYEPIFAIGSYSNEETDGKIVHLLSCETGQKLGPDFVAHGCRAYFGYDENFTFQMDTADVFFECDSEIDRAFAEGLIAREVHKRAIARFDKYIAKFRAAGQNYKAATLEFDRDHLRSPASGAQWGNQHARLE